MKPNSAIKKPLPSEWRGLDILALLKAANRTAVGKQTQRWYDAEAELVRLHNRREQISNDRVMASVIDQRIDDGQAATTQMAKTIADTPACNAVDIICKLVVSRRLDCGEETPGTQLTESAMLDLARFVKSAKRERS